MNNDLKKLVDDCEDKYIMEHVKSECSNCGMYMPIYDSTGLCFLCKLPKPATKRKKEK